MLFSFQKQMGRPKIEIAAASSTKTELVGIALADSFRNQYERQ